MIVQIALCDDEITELVKTEQLLNAYEQKYSDLDFEIQCFDSADRLLDMVREHAYVPDLVFMDIYMSGEQGEIVPAGMAAAKKLRVLGNEAQLFFLTNSKEHALEAFDVEASCYLVKPVVKETLFSKLDKFLEYVKQKRGKCILLKKKGVF